MDLKYLGLQRIKFDPGGLNNYTNKITGKEGDIGTRGLLVEFEKGLGCRLYIKSKEETYEIQADEIRDGVYEVIYPMNLRAGIKQAEIKFYKDNEILSSFIFEIKIYRSLQEVRH